MKRTALFVMLTATLLPAVAALAQPNDFDSQLSGLRKNIIAVCGRLQAAGPETAPVQMAAAVDSIISGWKSLQETYQDNPPQAYANDPAWKGYFAEAADNFALMRAKASEANYKRAAQFCGLNCALFVKIHQVNGVETLTDRMFPLRQAMMLAKAMTAAGNKMGAVRLLKRHLKDFDQMPFGNMDAAKIPEAKTNMALLKKGYTGLLKTINQKEKKETESAFLQYLGQFNKIYVKYI